MNTEIKEARAVSGIFFRFKNPQTEKWENRTFEDLPSTEQDRVMKDRSVEWLQSLSKSLAATLYEVCEKFGITTIPEQESEKEQ